MKLYLIWGYSNAVVYGQENSAKDLVYIGSNEEKALARLEHLEKTVGVKFNVIYRLVERELDED